MLGADTVIAAKGADAATDLARLHEGKLNLHASIAYAFLPRADIDALLARLAAEPARHPNREPATTRAGIAYTSTSGEASATSAT